MIKVAEIHLSNGPSHKVLLLPVGLTLHTSLSILSGFALNPLTHIHMWLQVDASSSGCTFEQFPALLGHCSAHAGCVLLCLLPFPWSIRLSIHPNGSPLSEGYVTSLCIRVPLSAGSSHILTKTLLQQ